MAIPMAGVSILSICGGFRVLDPPDLDPLLFFFAMVAFFSNKTGCAESGQLLKSVRSDR